MLARYVSGQINLVRGGPAKDRVCGLCTTEHVLLQPQHKAMFRPQCPDKRLGRNGPPWWPSRSPCLTAANCSECRQHVRRALFDRRDCDKTKPHVWNSSAYGVSLGSQGWAMQWQQSTEFSVTFQHFIKATTQLGLNLVNLTNKFVHKVKLCVSSLKFWPYFRRRTGLHF
jgi:hypothetical protein